MPLSPSDLHVVAGYSNHRRYAVRPRLLNLWLEYILDCGVSLTIVQHTLGERAPDLDPETNPHLRRVNLVNLRGPAQYEIWLQYALYNVGFSRLPDTAKYICWQDTDVQHIRSDWVMETLHMLQHHRLGQTWASAVDLDPKQNAVKNEWGNWVDRSFCAAWRAGDIDAAPSKAMLQKGSTADWRSHTGYSWAIRRDTLRGIGRLLDWLVAGSGDYHMMMGFSGRLREMVKTDLGKGREKAYSPSYYRRLLEFADRCDAHVKQDIGVVDGLILHPWHGSKKNRFYGAREAILTEAHFDPDRDITYDASGLPALAGDNRALRDGLRRYNTMRNEDSIDD